ncbi:MAG: glycosyltransferase [Clostridiales bacterium]|nr:glycosyltransferase [Clostridiales bacterium]
MKKVYYIGELPPPYGGVAVKNALIYESILSDKNVEMIDMVDCRRGVIKTIKCCLKFIRALLGKNDIIVGLGASNRRDFVLKAYRILHGKSSLNRVHLMTMGGRFHKFVEESPFLQETVKYLGTIWVEAYSIKDAIEKYGAKNVKYFPNCRTSAGKVAPRVSFPDEPLRLVFYSRICEEKGLYDVLQLKDFLEENNLVIDFYGEIEKKDKERFELAVSTSKCFVYKGVFDAAHNSVYKMLNAYDVLLFPTHWKGEGVPGVLVEAKFAGITVIASDWNYNKEIIRDDKDGIIVKNLEEMRSEIARLKDDRKLLDRLKKCSFESGVRYEIETYREDLWRCLNC